MASRWRNVPRGGPQPADVGLTAVFLVPSLAQVLLDPIASRPVGVAVALVSVLPLAWRRAYPLGAAFVGTAGWLVPTQGYLYLGYVVAVLLFFSVGTHVTSILRTAAITGWASAVGVFATLTSDQPEGAVFGPVLAVLAPVIAGRLVAHQRAQTARLQELTSRLQNERASAERAAVAEERARVARELHDVVGHDVTVIALQADAAAAAIDTAPELAKAPIAGISQSAHQALDEMRHVLRGLRTDEADPGLRPQPGIADVHELVERARALGAEVDLIVRGRQATESASVELAVYRIVQESLTNARRHAPNAAVLIQVSWSPHGVDVNVANPAHRPRVDSMPGFGLVGMAERVRLLGGELRTGFTHDGRFTVAARLPYENTSWT